MPPDVWSTAFQLLGVGMISIFSILFLVVASGTLLIRIVNRFTPEPPLPPKDPPAAIPPSILAAITAAVSVVTESKGRITHIRKSDS